VTKEKLHTVTKEFDAYKTQAEATITKSKFDLLEEQRKVKNAEEVREKKIKEAERANLQNSMLNDWRGKSSDFFREKYDYEASRIQKLQQANRALQNQIFMANTSFERYISNKMMQK